MKKILIVLILQLVFINISDCQLIVNPDINTDLKNKHWKANWVKVPNSPAYDYGVYFFRNKLVLEEQPEKYIIHVSADNRYKIYVNEEWIGLGPARSDADNWVYESYDIASFLQPGENIISAEVWNFGEMKPWAQISLFTGFLVQGDDERSSQLNTPGTWKCKTISAINAMEVSRAAMGTFIIVGPGDHIDGLAYPWNWKNPDFDASNWESPTPLDPGMPKGVGTDITHALVPRSIPAMELTRMPSPVIRKIDDTSSGNKQKLENFSIQANTKKTLLLDQELLITAYPEFILSGGKGSSLKISYAEALFDDSDTKQHRDSIEGMHFKGNSDIILNDGKDNRKYTSLWFRTFRYILLEIETSDEALTINSLTPIFTAYPFKEKAFFECSDKSIDKIWEVGWQTSRLCANELFYDCPYYEQMQYVGDTRVQALITLYVSGDDRLMRKAIDDYYHSIIPEGLTQSRYPTEPRQIIPTYSLFWVSMIHDYLWYRNDYMFAANYLTSIQHILQWFENRIDKKTGMLGPIEYWPFVDWTEQWPWDNEKRIGGVPPGGQEGNSSIITLQYAMTLDEAADIFNFFGLENLASDYSKKADALIASTKKLCWDESKGLFADTPGKKSFSQHANTFAVLTNSIKKADQALFMEKVLRDESLVQSSLYFKFYVNRAAIQSGLGNKYISSLKPWQDMIDEGLTTFAEIPDTDNTRSDCHAWSSSPLYELLATVAGIKPAGVGFEAVIIEPHPGTLKWLKAGFPHFYGDLLLDLKFDTKGSVKGIINVPAGLKGIFVWDGQTLDLIPGKQKITMNSMNSRFIAK